MRSHGVEQRKTRAFGEVTIEGTGVPTRSVVGNFLAGDSVAMCARWWSVSQVQVEDAIRYEMCRRSRRKRYAWARRLHRASRGAS